MLVRAFRLTDKLGNAALKTFTWLTGLLIAYVQALTAGATDTFTVIAGSALRVAAVVGGVLWVVLFFLGSNIAALARLLFAGGMFLVARFGGGATAASRQVAQTTRTAAGTAEQRRSDHVARRAEELAETVVLVEDPLKARNRTLSALIVVLLLAVVGLILWATSAGPGTPVVVAPGAGAAVLTTPDSQPSPFATAVPTVTPRPEPLRVGGSLVYTVRENGQDDLWATQIGQEEPVRLTNHPADDRDPAWSPDGRQLAFASNRDGNWELYVQSMATGDVTRLTYTLGFEGAPSWSPDGEWLVYEGYNEDNLDIYITRLDGTQGPIRLTYGPMPDFEPAWSPGGREIAYVSWRDGNQDIYTLSLDDPTEELALNLTNTPDINEEHPAWSSPSGLNIAYSALTDGLEVVYAKRIDAINEPPAVIDRGRMPTWSPDGSSLVYVVEQAGRNLLVAGQYQPTEGATSQAMALRASANDPDWTSAELPIQGVAESGAMAESIGPLYTEQISVQNDAPYYRLLLLNGVPDAPSPHLSDRVNDSFVALRQAVLDATGADHLGAIEDAFWRLDQPPEPGQERLNWHMAGRAFSLNRNLLYGFPAPIEVVREDVGVHTYWRIYVRAAVQDGQLGEPLRQMPWDFTARTSGDVQAYDDGGRLRGAISSGYYVDLTELAEDYGWFRVPADRTWRYNFGGVLFWEFVKTEGLTWEEAMLELYGADELITFLTEPTPFPTSTLAPPTATPESTNTPTPVPPDQQPLPEDEVPPVEEAPPAGENTEQPTP